MTSATNLHVLLVGIDAYAIPECSLYGCVNDIDAVQGILLDGAGVPAARITRLAAAHAGTTPDERVVSGAPTLANLRAALARLGTGAVAAGDRVLIYYSGHGARVPVRAGGLTTWREALVPMDISAAGNYLFDHELAALLAAISARTRQVTVILDCCHSGGATRGPESGVRQIDHYRHLGASGPVEAQVEAPRSPGIRGEGGVCQVIAACLGHELAEERRDAAGVRHGLLTTALTAALAGRSGDALHELRWGSIWPRMCADVAARNVGQHPCMVGTPGRAVLGGPPTEGDFGLTLTVLGEGRFEVGAGTLMGVTVGAQLAVYGPGLADFPALDSAEDRAQRVFATLLTVTDAEPGRAFASAAEAGLVVPAGARARVVVPGPDALLRVAVVAAAGQSAGDEDRALMAALTATRLAVIVDADAAELRLVRRRGGWALYDGLHREHPSAPPLCVLPLDEVARTGLLCAQYLRYSLPLRIARQCAQGQLVVELLAVPKDSSLTPAQAQLPALPGVLAGEYAAELQAGDRYCVRVDNRGGRTLRVTLVVMLASGRVRHLGDVAIEARSVHVFWADGRPGEAFEAALAGGSEGVDRIVAVGTSALAQDLRYLTHGVGWAETVRQTRSRSAAQGHGDRLPTSERWTATIVDVHIRE